MRLLLSLLSLLPAAAASPPNTLDVVLDYGTFRGQRLAAYNISLWKTIPYAAPPVGANRFRAPQPPPPQPPGAVYDTARAFPACPQREAAGQEDCLYLGVYGRPWPPSAPLRPVVVVFYGGGFIRGSAELGTPPSAYPVLNATDDNDSLLFVYPNYRTNVFGFLPGRQVGPGGADDAPAHPNAGLLDQRAALRWVRRHIGAFGGDAARVSIWGQSAGGGSVVAQAAAQAAAASMAGGEPPLFSRALASSPYWPKTYRFDAAPAQRVYDALAARVGCAPSAPESLACLRNASVPTLRAAALAMSGDRDATAASSYVWAPVLEDGFLRQPLTSLAGVGAPRQSLAAFATYNTHEGESFVPTWPIQSATTNGSDPFGGWLRRYLPDLAPEDAGEVSRLYPETGDVEDDGGHGGGAGADDGASDASERSAYAAGNPSGRAGLVYRDVTLACPALWMAGLGEDAWLGEYAIAPAKHASDTYWWNTASPAQAADPLHYRGYAGAIASFLAAGNPNAHKLTAADEAGVPRVASGRAWTVARRGFGTHSLRVLERRCAFWRRAGERISV